MNMKKITAAVLSVVCAASLAACGSSASTADTQAASASSAAATSAAAEGNAVDAIKEKGTIVMYTNAEFEPFEYKDGDQIVGIDVEIAQAIADKLGVELQIEDIAFDSLISALTTGKADFVAAGMTATEDRAKNVDFTEKYFDAGQSIIVAEGSDITSREDLNDKVVGVQTGTTGDIYCTNDDGSSDINVKEVKRYPKGMDAVSDLIAGRIDAVVIDNFPAEKLTEKNPDKVHMLDEQMTTEEYAIACPKGSDLTDEINGVIDEMEESGELDEIVGKYISAE
ncbi:MAG: transporter substrate-binding domain-containing protein [Eubacterium sp.]|nr:transporter substrate-binding domain-containing protein [Eubacterium sp.]